MSEIPLQLQRKFEQRWASKLVLPVAAAGTESTGLKVILLSTVCNALQSLTKFTTGA
jgi:hypothetical protein